MPSRAPLACRAPGCPNVQPCPDHPPPQWSGRARGRRMPPGWDATRRRVLDRDGHRCRACGAPAAEVHHTLPGREDDASLVSLCRACHRQVTARQAAEAARTARP